MMHILSHILIRVFAEAIARIFTLEVAIEPKVFDPTSAARAFSALGAVLILGMGGVLMISMSGQWLRRWIFPKKDATLLASSHSQTGKLDWAKPISNRSGSLDGDDILDSQSTDTNE